MINPVKTALLFTLASSFFAVPVQAQTMRCKNDLANVGENKASVLQKCGEPLQRDSFCKPQEKTQVPQAGAGATVINVNPCETVDEWTYNPGRGQFMTTLRFESGRLTAITYGDRAK